MLRLHTRLIKSKTTATHGNRIETATRQYSNTTADHWVHAEAASNAIAFLPAIGIHSPQSLKCDHY